jgi:hypothetical protein
MTQVPRQSQYDADGIPPYPLAIPSMSGIWRCPLASAI